MPTSRMRVSRREHALSSTKWKRRHLLSLFFARTLDPDPEIISFCADPDPGPGARATYARGKNCITDARCDQSFLGVERNCRASCVRVPFERGNRGSEHLLLSVAPRRYYTYTTRFDSSPLLLFVSACLCLPLVCRASTFPRNHRAAPIRSAFPLILSSDRHACYPVSGREKTSKFNILIVLLSAERLSLITRRLFPFRHNAPVGGVPLSTRWRSH